MSQPSFAAQSPQSWASNKAHHPEVSSEAWTAMSVNLSSASALVLVEMGLTRRSHLKVGDVWMMCVGVSFHLLLDPPP
jgi:hypothetical protein